MAKFNFNLRDRSSKTETGIHLVVRWNNNRLVFPTREAINPKYWETGKQKKNFQRAKETKQFPEYPEFNARLDKIEADAKDVFRQYENNHQHRQPTIEELRSLLTIKLNPAEVGVKNDLFSFIERQIKEASNKVNDKTGKMFTPATLQIYSNTLAKLEEYKQVKRRRIDFDSIDLDFYHDFTEYLSKTNGYALNTIGKYIKTLKTFLNEATERGVNKSIAYKSKRFKVVKEDTESIYLTEKELKELENLALSDNARLDRVRDLFLVGCWTGLRFSDFSNIQPHNIQGDLISIQTKKTGESVVIPIHPIVKSIMAKYAGSYANSLPPSISNVKMNEYLKELGRLVPSLHSLTSTSITKRGVNITKTTHKFELLTTHTARRSFASNLYVGGLAPSIIMKITGHKTEKAFMRYIKITPNESAKVLQLHWAKKAEVV